MTRRRFVNSAPQLTLASSITNSATSCAVSGTFAGYPTQFPFYAELDYGTASAEVILVANIVGATATITRGQDGTAAITHAAGATFDFAVVAADFDEANAHVNANSGVHGRSGNLVGDTDAQTLTNKTLSAPTLSGTVPNTSIFSGNPAVTGKASTGGGKSLSLQNSAGVEKLSVLDTGNLTTSGTVAATGAATAASFTANGDGKVTGVHVPKTYTNEAAATAASANVAGAIVWLTAATTGPVGLYVWDTSAAAWLNVQIDTPFLGEASSASLVTLSTTAAFAGLASVTFTLARQMRVKIEVSVEYDNAAGAVATYQTIAGYNSGASPVIGSFVGVGKANQINYASVRPFSGNAFGTALLAAGQYTAYASEKRVSGGQATDTAGPHYVLVTALGSV